MVISALTNMGTAIIVLAVLWIVIYFFYPNDKGGTAP